MRSIYVSMPSRAYTSLLRMIKIATIKELTLGVNALSGLYLIVTKLRKKLIIGFVRCQCPLGLIPHCYPDVNDVMNFILNVSMPSRAYTSLLQRLRRNRSSCKSYSVNALSGLYLIVTHLFLFGKLRYKSRVSMPSRAYTSLLRRGSFTDLISLLRCQCPLGLIPHCYCNVWHVGKRRHLYQCQCPLGLIPHCYDICDVFVINNKSVSMPSRAYTSLLQYPFKNLGFMRFPEPIFAGICQNILIITHFHAC